MYPIRKQHHKLLHIYGGKNHNHAVFPNYVPSIPEDNSSQGLKSYEGTQKFYKNVYQDEMSGDDYNMIMSAQKMSPKNRGFSQTQQYTLFKSSGIQTGIIG